MSALGASVALPWLESARAFGVETAKAAPKRFAFLFFGDGIHPPEWWSNDDFEHYREPIFIAFQRRFHFIQ